MSNRKDTQHTPCSQSANVIGCWVHHGMRSVFARPQALAPWAPCLREDPLEKHSALNIKATRRQHGSNSDYTQMLEEHTPPIATPTRGYISAHLHILALRSYIFTSRSSSLFLLRPGAAAGAPRNAALCRDRACRVREMWARVRFGPVRRNPLRRSCVSSARNVGESAIWRKPRMSLCSTLEPSQNTFAGGRFAPSDCIKSNAALDHRDCFQTAKS